MLSQIPQCFRLYDCSVFDFFSQNHIYTELLLSRINPMEHFMLLTPDESISLN